MTTQRCLPAEQAGRRNACVQVGPGSRPAADSVEFPLPAASSSPRPTLGSVPPSSSPAAARTPLSASDSQPPLHSPASWSGPARLSHELQTASTANILQCLSAMCPRQASICQNNLLTWGKFIEK